MTSALSPMSLLDRFGPDANGPALSLDEARAYVRDLTVSHYENFSVLSRLVPERLQDGFAAVYAFCRWSDDLGDETGVGESARTKSLELLSWWREELQSAYGQGPRASSGPRHPVMIALRQIVNRFEIPIQPFDDLICAFEQDQRMTRYETWDQLTDYCSRSANPVGRIVLHLGGIDGAQPKHAELFSMSDAICTALQLTNFWQDVRRDLFERDRIYLPRAETGLSAELLRDWAGRIDDPGARVPFIHALRPLVERTWPLFEQGRPLPFELASDLSPVIWLFVKGGESVLRAVERNGCTTLWRRPTLTRPKKLFLVLLAGLLRPGKRGS